MMLVFFQKIFEILFDANFKNNMSNKKLELARNVDEASTVINYVEELLNNRYKILNFINLK